jgi:hypothetical protein
MGEMCDFEAEFHPENWNMPRRAKKTPKQRVVAKHPKAYALKYEHLACVYDKPAQAVPRGRMASAVVIGTAPSVRGAWLDAANRLRKRRTQEGE